MLNFHLEKSKIKDSEVVIMPFKRKIYKQMLDWKNESSKNSALLIEGARRTGKTTIVKEFGKKEYSDFIYIDFTYASDELKTLFKRVDPNNKQIMDQFFSDLFLLVGKSLKPGGLIIFDEIQNCSEARQDIKAFVQDGRYDYIETGSLISIRENVQNIQIPSEERRIEMHPLDFEEFCWAFNDESKCDLLRNIYEDHLSISESSHEKQMNDLRLYLALGGMPKVVSLYQETQSFMRCDKEKKDILKLYEDDLRKHDNIHGTICLPIYKKMFTSLHSWSKKIKTGIKNERDELLFQRSLKDLEDSKIVNAVYKISDLSFGSNMYDNSNVKLYPLDVGLVLSELISEGEETIEDAYKKIRFGKLSGANLGIIYECLVCQNLVANGIKPSYHVFESNISNKKNRYELDFVHYKKGKLSVIEVKSTTRFETNSLDALDKKYPQLKMNKIIVSPKLLQWGQTITYCPIYMSFLL